MTPTRGEENGDWSSNDRVKLGQLLIDARHTRGQLAEVRKTLEDVRRDLVESRRDFFERIDSLEQKYVTRAEYRVVWTVFTWVGIPTVAAVIGAFYKLVVNP